MDQKRKAQKRVVVYISEEKHRKLHAKLILEGKSISTWIRAKIDKFLE